MDDGLDGRDAVEDSAVTYADHLSGEADGPMMSVDELKQEMFKSLRDTGTIEAIRAQLRRRFIEKLKQHGRRVAREADNNADSPTACDEREKWSVDEQLVHGLIHEYLQRQSMEHTLAVFVPEIGGAQQLLSRDTAVQMLRLPETLLANSNNDSNSNNTEKPLLTVLLHELVRRLAVVTMVSATQTVMDCQDHRLALENQLRRVETTYLAECASQKTDNSVRSFDERVLRYQREYDELCEKRLHEDLERFKATELGLMRVEERKRYDRELDSVKTTLFQEHRERLQRLQDRERELEMAFAANKAELETSLFEARQRVFQDIEKLRVKQQDVEAKVNAETRQFASEAKRLQLLEEMVKAREENLQSAVDGMLREKERTWQLEKLQWQSDAKAREQQLLVREHDVEESLKIVKQEKDTLKALRNAMKTLEDESVTTQSALAAAQTRLAKVEAEKKLLSDDLLAREEMLSEDKHSMKSLSYENARLSAELKAIQSERSKLEDIVVERTSEAKQLEAEVKDLQHQLINLKLNEANAVVDERKKLMTILEEERADARWKENELVGRLRELQTRLAESEASAEKFQTQYDDEKVHVETLRHEVSSLHTLLAQTQSAASTRHPSGGRSSSAARNQVSMDPSSDSNERMLMKMMEMMSQMASMQGFRPLDTQQIQQTPFQRPSMTELSPAQNEAGVRADAPPKLQEATEMLRLKEQQDRRERELLEQREFDRKKKEREETEERELEQKRKKFQDEMEQERLDRIKQETALGEERQRRFAEQDALLQEELEKQKRAIDEAREIQRKLLDDQIAEEQRRLHRERIQDEERARIAKEEADVAVIRVQRLQEEREEEERRRRTHEEEAEAQLRREREKKEAVGEREVAAKRAQEITLQQQLEDQRNVVAHPTAGSCDIQSGHGSTRTVDTRELADEDHDNSRRDQQEHDSNLIGDASSSSDESRSGGATTQKTEREIQVESPVEDTTATTVVAQDESQSEPHPVVPGKGPTATEIVVTENEELPEQMTTPAVQERSEEELEEERRKAAEEAKKKEDEASLDVYRQRVLARRAADKQRQQEEEEQKKREEEERAAAELARLQADDSESELEKSGGSFASSAASSSGSF